MLIIKGMHFISVHSWSNLIPSSLAYGETSIHLIVCYGPVWDIDEQLSREKNFGD